MPQKHCNKLHWRHNPVWNLSLLLPCTTLQHLGLLGSKCISSDPALTDQWLVPAKLCPQAPEGDHDQFPLWLQLHKRVQLLALLCLLAGFLLATACFGRLLGRVRSSGQEHAFVYPHIGVGVAVMCMAACQIVMSIMRPVVVAVGWSGGWSVIHAAWGFLTLLLGET
jgi:hypothetical protein